MDRDDAARILKEAIREETVRQYRDNDRAKCPAGAYYYEEEIGPYLIAEVVISKLEEAGLLLYKRSRPIHIGRKS